VIPAAQLGLLGLGLRAGHVVVGTSGVRDGLRRGDLALVIFAEDRSTRTNEKVIRLAAARGVPLLEGPRADELGRRLGRDTVQAVGIKDPKLAAGIFKAQETQDHQEAE
jgi:ribosomal protein L7Ae-like RNA K-turn-binding protein